MILYATRPGRRLWQIVSDLATVIWIVGWWWVGRLLDSSIRVLAEPARMASGAISTVHDGIAGAADRAGSVPGLGESIRQPLDEAARGLADLSGSVGSQIVAIERVATLAGWIVFLAPLALWLTIWLPRRVRFIRNATAAVRFLDSSADLDLFALRAMATQPMHRIAEISDDPVRAWHERDQVTIGRLARLSLEADGLRFPVEWGALPDARATSAALDRRRR